MLVGVYDLSILAVRFDRATPALKCDLRDDASTRERLARYGMQAVQYEEGLATARRIRASRYLGMQSHFPTSIFFWSSHLSMGRVQLKTQSWRQGGVL